MKIKYILALLIAGILINVNIAEAFAAFAFNQTITPNNNIKKNGLFQFKFWVKNTGPFFVASDVRCWLEEANDQITDICETGVGDGSDAFRIINGTATCNDANMHGCFLDSDFIAGGYKYKLNYSSENALISTPGKFVFWLQVCTSAPSTNISANIDFDIMGSGNCISDARWVGIKNTIKRLRGSFKMKIRGLTTLFRLRG